MKWHRLWPRKPGEFHGFNQPYILGFTSALAATAREAADMGSLEPVDVVFDNHDKFKGVMQRLYPPIRKQIGSTFPTLAVDPLFRDDRNFVVLQVADLLASESRNAAEKRGDEFKWTQQWCPRLRVSPHSQLLDSAALRALDEQMLTFAKHLQDESVIR